MFESCGAGTLTRGATAMSPELLTVIVASGESSTSDFTSLSESSSHVKLVKRKTQSYFLFEQYIKSVEFESSVLVEY